MNSEIDEAVTALRTAWQTLKLRIREPSHTAASYRQPPQIDHIFYLVSDVESALDEVTSKLGIGTRVSQTAELGLR